MTIKNVTSAQDRSISRYTLPPCTTKRKTTTNLKTKNNYNCQKIKLYGSLTIKELKKHSSRLIGGVEMGSYGREDSWQGGVWQTRQTHICAWINPEERLGRETDWATQGSITGKQSLKTFNRKKICGDWGSRRNSWPHRRVWWRDPQGPRIYTNPPTWESAQEEPNLLVGSRGSDWEPAKSWASCIVPSQTPPPHSAPQPSNMGCPALANI